MVKEKEEVVIKFRGGGSIINLAPVFSDDSSRIYVAWKNVVLCYNPITAIRILEYEGLMHQIVGFGCTYLHNQEVIVACTVFGVVHVWQASTAFTVAKYRCRVNVCFFKLLAIYGDAVPKAFITIKDGEDYKFALMNLKTGMLQVQKLNLKKKRKNMQIDVSISGKYYAIIQGNKLYFNHFYAETINKHNIASRNFTCLICHPELECVVTGDNTGRIVVWHFSQYKSIQSVFHWHTNPVNCLSFSSTNTQFFSGGSECVLVKWQMEDNVHKQFLPRLPSAIYKISVANDNSLIAIATTDNAIQIIDSRFNYVNVIQHLVLGSNYSAGITYDPRTKALILNGIVGHLQFYYPKDLSLLYNLDVVCQNKFTNERNVKIISTVVTKISIDKTGIWMATVECRNDPEFPESRLKFWFFDNTKQNFVLNTCIEEPHSDAITNIVFQPTYEKEDAACVTSGKDKKFKIWKVVQVSTVYYEGHSWQCMNVVFYRDLTPNAIAFATDGTLLAVSFDSTVTTWLPNSCELKCSLQHPSCQEDLIHVSFGVGPQCHLLVSATFNLINVWNLLTLSLTWIVYVDVSFIISDPLTSFKAVFTKNKTVYIFEPKSPNPVYFSEKCLENIAEIKTATFVPHLHSSDMNLNWYQCSQIYFVDSNQEMYSIEKNEEITKARMIQDENPINSLFGYSLPKTRSGANSNFKIMHLYTRDDKSDRIKQLLDVPIHTMAPLHLTGEDILKSMILENKKAEIEKNANEEHINDEKPKHKSRTLNLVDESNLLTLSEVDLNSTSWTSIFLS